MGGTLPDRCRSLLFPAMAVALAACTAPAAPPVAAEPRLAAIPAAEPATARPSRLRLVRPPRKPPIPAAQPEAALPAPDLIGLSEGALRRAFGEPAEEIDRPPGKVWRYGAEGCRLEVHLFPDLVRGGLVTLDHSLRAETGNAGHCWGRLRRHGG